MMNQAQAAKEIANRINSHEPFRAKLRFEAGGRVAVSCEKNSGGKRGWISAGEITVFRSIEVSREAVFEFRYFREVLDAAIAGIEYTFESQPQPQPHAAKLAHTAKEYRAGRQVDEDLIVECVAAGYLTSSEAMNRDL